MKDISWSPVCVQIFATIMHIQYNILKHDVPHIGIDLFISYHFSFVFDLQTPTQRQWGW